MAKIYILTKLINKKNDKIIGVRCSIPSKYVDNWESIRINKISDTKIELERNS